MAERSKVLIIDDDKVWHAFLSAALADQYEVKTAANGDVGLFEAGEWRPDTILLDIEMPVKNGYEVCKALKSNPSTQDIPVIFLSSKSSLQEKITGFQLGADDYLVKPCEAELLNVKVLRSTTIYRHKKELGEKASGAQVLAFEAMNSSADLGRSLRFAERTYAMHSFDKLAEGLFQTMSEFGLDASVMFITDTGPQFYAANNHELSPLEKDMFLAIHQEGRFCDFGCRTFCNFKLVSLLIKNMPESDPERYGRIKDTVPWIMGVTDGKVGALDVHNTLMGQHQQISESITNLQVKLKSTVDSFQHANANLAIGVADLHSVIEKGVVNEDQALLATNSYSSIAEQLAVQGNLELDLLDSVGMLDALLIEQARMTEIVRSEVANDLNIELGEDEIFSSDIDFF